LRLAQEGRGIMFAWPLTEQRYHFPWRPIPDAPTGLAFFSRKGMLGLALELAYFSPFTLYALLSRAARRPRRPRIPVAVGSTSLSS
jgi:inner membrane protein